MMGPMGVIMMMKVMGLTAFIITSLLLAVSFFVLLAAYKIEQRWLKVFGYVVTILLWFSAAIVFSGVISAATMKCNFEGPMKQRMHMMKARKQQMMPGQMQKMQGQQQDQPQMPEKAEQAKLGQ
jgi:predicted membrane protein